MGHAHLTQDRRGLHLCRPRRFYGCFQPNLSLSRPARTPFHGSVVDVTRIPFGGRAFVSTGRSQYGFLGAETNQWYPDLVHDNHPVEQPSTPEDGYHFGTDITDRALAFIRDAKAVAPEKPFLLYYCPGACHAPHHAPTEWSDKYRGKFDMGYEAYREQVFQRQQTMGLLSEQAELSPINPYIDRTSKSGKPWPELDTVRPWESLTDEEKRLFARMAEVYAGFLSHADHQIGRLLDYLDESGQLDNTIIVLVSDNGASGEGGPNGSVNENKIFNGLPDRIEENLDHLDVLGTPLTYNHYPTGWAWAFNTPFKLWKRYANYEGGTADPMIVSWPRRIAASGVRPQYTHAIDIVPTLYECIGVEPPETLKGYPQVPLEGVSFVASFDDAGAKTEKQTQFYSMGGTRAIWQDGWKAAAVTAAAPDAWADYPTQEWELFDTRLDPSECHDLSAEHPEKLQELIAVWWTQAEQYNALPLENRGVVEVLGTKRPQIAKPRDRYIYYPGCAEVPESVAPNIRNRSYTIAVEAEIETPDASGVLFSHGARFGGHALYLKDGKLKYVYNWVGLQEQIVESTEPITTGHQVLSATFEREGDTMPAEGTLTLHIGTAKVGQGRIKTQPGKFSIAGEGLNIGKDSGEPITDDYAGTSPWPFVGGVIKRAVIDVSGDPFIDLAREAAMAFARDSTHLLAGATGRTSSPRTAFTQTALLHLGHGPRADELEPLIRRTFRSMRSRTCSFDLRRISTRARSRAYLRSSSKSAPARLAPGAGVVCPVRHSGREVVGQWSIRARGVGPGCWRSWWPWSYRAARSRPARDPRIPRRPWPLAVPILDPRTWITWGIQMRCRPGR
jgi:arylsulfatase A-like enzyme